MVCIDCAPVTDQKITPDFDQLRTMWAAGDTPSAISAATGIPYSSIYYHAARMGLKPRKVRKAHDAEVAEGWQAGETVPAMAERLGIGPDAVRGAVRRQELPNRRVKDHLTPEQAEEFERSWLEHANVSRIVERFDMPRSAVYSRRARMGLPEAQQVRMARVVELYAQGMRPTEIAAQLGMSRRGVNLLRQTAGIAPRGRWGWDAA